MLEKLQTNRKKIQNGIQWGDGGKWQEIVQHSMYRENVIQFIAIFIVFRSFFCNQVIFFYISLCCVLQFNRFSLVYFPSPMPIENVMPVRQYQNGWNGNRNEKLFATETSVIWILRSISKNPSPPRSTSSVAAHMRLRYGGCSAGAVFRCWDWHLMNKFPETLYYSFRLNILCWSNQK